MKIEDLLSKISNYSRKDTMEHIYDVLKRNEDLLPQQFVIDDTIYPFSLDDTKMQSTILAGMLKFFIEIEEYEKCNDIVKFQKILGHE
jgi:hypothetical protein